MAKLTKLANFRQNFFFAWRYCRFWRYRQYRQDCHANFYRTGMACRGKEEAKERGVALASDAEDEKRRRGAPTGKV